MSRFVRRNDPCPCGSGKKYKKCCLNKEDNPDFSNIANLPNIYKDGRKHARFKECIHPDKAHCSERIIGAHTIQNNKYYPGFRTTESCICLVQNLICNSVFKTNMDAKRQQHLPVFADTMTRLHFSQ